MGIDRRGLRYMIIMTIMTLVPAAALADAGATASPMADDLLKALDPGRLTNAIGILFLLAILLETALTVLFTWPVFLNRINRRNMRAPISFLAAILLVLALKLDFLGMVQQSIHGTHEPNWLFNLVLTALILAGGSAGVRNMAVSLGLVTPSEVHEAAQRPPPGKGWLAVRVTGESGYVGARVLVQIVNKTGDAGGGTPIAPATVGVAKVANPRRPAGVILLDTARVPRAGGYPITKDTSFAVQIVREDDPASAVVAKSAEITMAEGAFIDLELKVGSSS